MTLLEKAQQFEDRFKREIPEDKRPLFHVTPTVGWLNDPNGFSGFKGEYHLFYQYHPYSTKWGPMHWGHCTTKDFIKWERKPIALAPDEAYESGCFSGSAIETPQGQHLLMYTAMKQVEKEDGTLEETQSQCIALGDGTTYKKYQGNPVITGADVPAGSSPVDFRDPKIWKEDGKYYAVIANRTDDGSGAILLYSSEDAYTWAFETVLERCRWEYGDMWECPDMFVLGDKRLLIISPMNMEAQDLEFHNGHGVIAMVGSYDKTSHVFQREKVCALDYGFDFYAPQTMETEDGRRIMIAWMQGWEGSGCQAYQTKWFGMMTLPREITWKENRIYQQPVREIEKYYGDSCTYENQKVDGEVSFPKVSGRTLDMTVDIEVADKNEPFYIQLAKNDKNYFQVAYMPQTHTVQIDRSKAGNRHDIVSRREFFVSDRGGKLRLRFIIDRFSVEIFANDGEQAFTSTLYETPMDAENITFHGKESIITVKAHKIEISNRMPL